MSQQRIYIPWLPIYGGDALLAIILGAVPFHGQITYFILRRSFYTSFSVLAHPSQRIKSLLFSQQHIAAQHDGYPCHISGFSLKADQSRIGDLRGTCLDRHTSFQIHVTRSFKFFHTVIGLLYSNNNYKRRMWKHNH